MEKSTSGHHVVQSTTNQDQAKVRGREGLRMKNFGGWQVIEPKLGSGGQGTVYKARSPKRTTAIAAARRRLRDAMTRIPDPQRFTPKPDEEADLTMFIS